MGLTIARDRCLARSTVIGSGQRREWWRWRRSRRYGACGGRSEGTSTAAAACKTIHLINGRNCWTLVCVSVTFASSDDCRTSERVLVEVETAMRRGCKDLRSRLQVSGLQAEQASYACTYACFPMSDAH